MSASSSSRKGHLIEGQTKKEPATVSLVRDKEGTTSEGDKDRWKERDGDSWKERVKLVLCDKDDCHVISVRARAKLGSTKETTSV